MALDTRGSGAVPFVRIPPLRWDGTALRTFWHSEYFRSSARHARAGELDPDTAAALDAYDGVAARADLRLEMELLRGDIQLISNHAVLHARSAFVDSATDPRQKRHLLRLWLSVGSPGSRSSWALTQLDRVRVLTAFVLARLNLN